MFHIGDSSNWRVVVAPARPQSSIASIERITSGSHLAAIFVRSQNTHKNASQVRQSQSTSKVVLNLAATVIREFTMSSLSATIHEYLRCTVVRLLHHHVKEHIKLPEYNASHAGMALLAQLTTLRVTKVTSTDPMQDNEAWVHE